MKTKQFLKSLMVLIMFAVMSTSFVYKEFPKFPFIALSVENKKVNLPRGFRTMLSSFSWGEKYDDFAYGLGNLQASGSAQFSEEGLTAILDLLGQNKNIMIVDLRQESHGYIDGHSIYWYSEHNWANLGKEKSQVLAEERNNLDLLVNRSEVMSYRIATKLPDGTPGTIVPFKIGNIQEVLSENELADKYNVGYIRFSVTDHIKPDDQEIDEFVAFINTLPENVWLHFHCNGGKGRTTTFLAMYDMMRNSKNVSFEDIISRQLLIGGNDLMKVPSKDSWKHYNLLERRNLLKLFYKYCHENDGTFTKPWSVWINEIGIVDFQS